MIRNETKEAFIFGSIALWVIGLIYFFIFWTQTVQLRADYAALKTICTANDIKEHTK